MGRPPTLAGALIAPLFLLLALTGCGGNTSLADPPVSPMPSTSSPPAPPKRETPEHFIRRWAEIEKRMENTGNTDAYLAVSHACRACRQLAADIRRFYSNGGFVRWAGWRIKSLETSGPYQGGHAYTVHVISEPTSYRTTSHGGIQHLSGGPSTHQLIIKFAEGRWHVTKKVQLSA
jgi:hypothetical protein